MAGEERWAAVEDAGRLRDALGTPLPVGIPEAFLAPRPTRSATWPRATPGRHGPFTAHDLAGWLGLGVAVVLDALRRLVAAGRLVEGELRPLASAAGDGTRAGGGLDYCDAQVLRTLRRRSLAALRAEVEPVPAVELARFLPRWQGIGGRLRGRRACCASWSSWPAPCCPRARWRRSCCPSRVEGYQPAVLDELMSAGEVLWSGHGALPGDDGWVALHLADTAPLTIAEPGELVLDRDPPGAAVGAGRRRRVLLPRARRRRGGPGRAHVRTPTSAAALWDLAWSGRVTGDTLAPLRGRLGGGRTAHRTRPSRPTRGRYAGSRAALASYAASGRPAARTGPPQVAGRWSLLPEPEPDPTLRAHAVAEVLLDRYGVVTRGAVVAERVPGGYAGVYKVLAAAEEAGRVRRGYFVEGLGAAQFAGAGAVDRLRAPEPRRPDETTQPAQPGTSARTGPGRQGGPDVRTLVLAAADPANPYGAALPWPVRAEDTATSHRPGRKAGALVVLVEGELVLYVERGGRTLLSWTEEPDALQSAADALALAVHDGALGRLTVERADGADVLGSEQPLARALERSGFHATPRGLRLRR